MLLDVPSRHERRARSSASTSINQHCSTFRVRLASTVRLIARALKYSVLRYSTTSPWCNLGLILYSPFMICGDIRPHYNVRTYASAREPILCSLFGSGLWPRQKLCLIPANTHSHSHAHMRDKVRQTRRVTATDDVASGS